MKSYVFPVALEADGDGWHASVPALEARGAATWGKIKDQALRNIQEVVQIEVEKLIGDGDPVPSSAATYEGTMVAVTM